MRLPRMNLTTWILLGFILGIITGLVFGDLCSVMKPLSEAFIKIWQITILPSVALSLIVGIGSLKRDTAKAIALKAGLILLLFWAICVIGYFSFQLAFPPRMEASFFSTQDLVVKTDINLIDQFIPSNPFLSLSDGIIPATVLFCLFLGFALMLDDGSGPILSMLRALLRALDRMTHIIAGTFPVGIFVITAVMAGTLTIEGFLELQVFLITLAAAAVLLGLVVMPLLVTCFTTFHYRDILAASSRAMLLAFSTGTEFITLPLISEGVEKLFQGQARDPGTGNGNDTDRAGDRDPGTGTRNDQDRAGDEQDPDRGDIRSYSEILVPVAYTFPLLGGLVPFLFILFVAWLYQNPLDPLEQVQLVVAGDPELLWLIQTLGDIAPGPNAPPCRCVQPVHQLGDPAPGLCGTLKRHLDLLVHHHHHRPHHGPGPVPVEEGGRVAPRRPPAGSPPDCRAACGLHVPAGRYLSWR